jgi:RNA polymerase sigma-70 factor, ECF subfamily
VRHYRSDPETLANRAKVDREWTERMTSAFEGDETAYRQLLKDTAKLARRIAWNYVRRSALSDGDIEDIVQETLLAVHRSRSRWQAQQGAMHWLAAIARYKAIDAVRSAIAREAAPLDEEALSLAAPERETAGVRLDLERLLARLRPRSREIVIAVMLRGESVAEVAQGLQMSQGAGRVALHRAMRKMAQATGGEPGRRRPAKRSETCTFPR